MGPVCRELFIAHRGSFMLNSSAFLIPFGADDKNLTNSQILTFSNNGI